MGKGTKKQPEKLPEKLLKIRKFFLFSQEEMIEFVDPEREDPVTARAAISDYEHGRRTPSLLEILNYTRAVRLFTRYKQFTAEDLIDDNRNLPFT